MTNKNAVNVKTLGGCFNEKIDREMSFIVDTLKDRIQNAVLTAIDSIVAPEIELAIRSKSASSGQDATSVTANSEQGEHIGITASFKNASGNNNVLHISNRNDETRDNFPEELSALSVPEARFQRQSHTHHIVTGQTTQTNQILEFLTGRILTARIPLSLQNQNLSA